MIFYRVLDKSGYIKIVDYGFCKKLPGNSSTNTMCGTPEYIPPEMVRSKPHNRAVDLWSFGVFLFELATRATPFEHNETVFMEFILKMNVLLCPLLYSLVYIGT